MLMLVRKLSLSEVKGARYDAIHDVDDIRAPTGARSAVLSHRPPDLSVLCVFAEACESIRRPLSWL